MNEVHPDRESFEIIWEQVVQKEISNYNSLYVNCIEIIPNVREEVWKKYVAMNKFCKLNYMSSTEGKLDRHKVAACYMIAILTSQPMKFVKKIEGHEVPLAINEMLAITVGLSIVRAFTISAINKECEVGQLDQTSADCLIAKFEKGIKIPSGNMVNHGSYLENYANELYLVTLEGKLNILSLAHELYLLEVITRIS